MKTENNIDDNPLPGKGKGALIGFAYGLVMIMILTVVGGPHGDMINLLTAENGLLRNMSGLRDLPGPANSLELIRNTLFVAHTAVAALVITFILGNMMIPIGALEWDEEQEMMRELNLKAEKKLAKSRQDSGHWSAELLAMF